MTDQPTITRFAPSPTGHLHVGGARTALFCWALARRHAGRMILRVEDTDQKRSTDEAARGILEDLSWLGILWDDGPEFAGLRGSAGGDDRDVGSFYQSQRLATYEAHFQKLLEAGLAYPAFDTPEQLNDMRKAAEKEKRTFVYRRDAGADHGADLERMKSQEHVLRFRMPEQDITLVDEVLGEITFPYAELDDLIIRKRDGFPTYHFAVVVDDALMGVTHVLRGQEHLNNTPRHIALQEALGFDRPAYAHMPLIFNPDGTKMSKRDKDKALKAVIRDAQKQDPDVLTSLAPVADLPEADLARWLKDKTSQLPPPVLAGLADHLGVALPEIEVEDFRKAGYLPQVITNYLAMLGWNPGMKNDDGTDLERFDLAFLAEHFSTGRIGKSNAKFDREKLLAFNADTIQHDMTDAEFGAAWNAWCQQEQPETPGALGDRWELAASAARPRAKTFKDAAAPLSFALVADNAIEYDEKAVKKGLLKGEPSGVHWLNLFSTEVLSAWDGPFEPDDIEAAVASFCETHEIGMGKIAGPLRVAITGTNVSPGLGHTLALVGLEGVNTRVRRCLETYQSEGA